MPRDFSTQPGRHDSSDGEVERLRGGESETSLMLRMMTSLISAHSGTASSNLMSTPKASPTHSQRTTASGDDDATPVVCAAPARPTSLPVLRRSASLPRLSPSPARLLPRSLSSSFVDAGLVAEADLGSPEGLCEDRPAPSAAESALAASLDLEESLEDSFAALCSGVSSNDSAAQPPLSSSPLRLVRLEHSPMKGQGHSSSASRGKAIVEAECGGALGTSWTTSESEEEEEVSWEDITIANK